MPLYQDEGVVLRTVKLGEADRIVTLLTRDHGKIRAVAKGVRRTKSRFGGRLEPFMRVSLLIAEGRSLDVISQAESVSAYARGICTDFQAYTAANVICETADKLVVTEHERSVAQYRLVLGALNALSKHAISADRTWVFSISAGGLMCSTDHIRESFDVSWNAICQLQALVDGDWGELDGTALFSETRQMVEKWGEYYLERPIRSMRLLD